jgi:eight-cysteine-cluster-containing protein
MKKGLFALLVLGLVIILLIVVFYIRDSRAVLEINSFEECASQGFPVMESYPSQCKTPDGRNFVEELDKGLNSMIRVFSPAPDEIVESHLTILGEARGYWFFEASFPVELLDAESKRIELDPSYIMTSSDWMTEEFVPFEATLTFSDPQTEFGTLILRKDNPSGLPENDAELRIPVRFFPTEIGEEEKLSNCRPTGCSGQVCASEDVITTCEFLPEYSCFSLAICERQVDGECGWTETPEFGNCKVNLSN